MELCGWRLEERFALGWRQVIGDFEFPNPQSAFHNRRKTGILPSGLKQLDYQGWE